MNPSRSCRAIRNCSCAVRPRSSVPGAEKKLLQDNTSEARKHREEKEDQEEESEEVAEKGRRNKARGE